MKKKIGCFLFLLCCCGFCAAQQVVSSGGYAVKSDISVNWILGEFNGFPLLIKHFKKYKEQLMEYELSFKVYPIPATDFINVEISQSTQVG
jgi:hypothetical protein